MDGIEYPASFPLDSRTITIGRDDGSDLVIRAIGVSHHHAEVSLVPDDIRVRDCDSRFGIRINGDAVVDGVLHDGDVLSVGIVSLHVKVVDNSVVLAHSWKAADSSDAVPETGESGITSIGRDTTNSIRLAHPLVSRYHCTVRRAKAQRLVVEDVGSTNGTFVNGTAVRRQQLEDGDTLQVGPYRFLVDLGRLVKADDATRIRLEAHGVNVARGGRRILHDISLTIQPGEFVAILGPSGAGKTTLARVLTGRLPAESGTVHYNGYPLHTFVAAFSSSIGFVSQHNLLRPELNVDETFREQALLRLPRDSLEAERIERIREVTEALDISHVAHSRIGVLSGGEAKRVHLGIELLSSPQIVFLDEPLAGLDPGLTRKFMELFSRLCKDGRTLMLATHTLEQVEFCTRLLFVNRGRLVYDGPPATAAEAMGVESVAEVYEKARCGEPLGVEPSPVRESGHPSMPAGRQRLATRYRPGSAGFFRQLGLLCGRYGKILVRDRANLALIVLQAPLIAILLSLVFGGDTRFLPLSFYFCVTISSVWMGGVNSVREIAREWELYDREFRAGLSPWAYASAKCGVSVSLAVCQALVFGLCLGRLFDSFDCGPETFALIAAGTGSGAILGLCISSFSGNVNRAVSLLPVVFIPQIFFSGILITFDRMPTAGRILSQLTVSRPVFSMFKCLCVLERPFGDLTEWWALLSLDLALFILTGVRVWSRGVRPFGA